MLLERLHRPLRTVAAALATRGNQPRLNRALRYLAACLLFNDSSDQIIVVDRSTVQRGLLASTVAGPAHFAFAIPFLHIVRAQCADVNQEMPLSKRADAQGLSPRLVA